MLIQMSYSRSPAVNREPGRVSCLPASDLLGGEEMNRKVTAYVDPDVNQMVFYDRTRTEPGDPLLILERSAWLELVRFVLAALDDDQEEVEAELHGMMGKVEE